MGCWLFERIEVWSIKVPDICRKVEKFDSSWDALSIFGIERWRNFWGRKKSIFFKS